MTEGSVHICTVQRNIKCLHFLVLFSTSGLVEHVCGSPSQFSACFVLGVGFLFLALCPFPQVVVQSDHGPYGHSTYLHEPML